MEGRGPYFRLRSRTPGASPSKNSRAGLFQGALQLVSPRIDLRCASEVTLGPARQNVDLEVEELSRANADIPHHC